MLDNAAASSNSLLAVPFSRVEVTGGMWSDIMRTNRRKTIPSQYLRCDETGRIDAFDLKERDGCGKVHFFWDSDVAKWIESAAYSLSQHPDKGLEDKVDRLVDAIGRHQADDGYFNCHFLLYRPEDRWTNLRDEHELYCAGHLMEAAVAYRRATGKPAFLDAMCRYADCIERAFGPEPDKRKGYPGHEEIEIGLVKLYEETGRERYLRLAEFFINERGQQGEDKRHYFDVEAEARGEGEPFQHRRGHALMDAQAHRPVREQTQIVGHAVRALYLYCGMADVAKHTEDTELLSACKRIWKSLVTRRMAITGGVGPQFRCEGMTCDYDLPDEITYLETCAAVALVFYAHRLFLATGQAHYLDEMERALYNGSISGLSRDGTHYFYGNPLSAYPGFDNKGAYHREKGYHYRRSLWMGCSCCPPNISRMIAQFAGYLYAVKASRLYLAHYAESRADLEIGDARVTVTQETDYPWDGRIAITVDPSRVFSWELALRIPQWCRCATLRVNGESVPSKTVAGFVRVRRRWRPGDTVILNLDMPVERISAHPSARQLVGRVALQRGPVVYCLEEVDNGPGLANVFLPEDAEFAIRKAPQSIGGVPALAATAYAQDLASWKNALYSAERSALTERPIVAVPYFLWANRRPGEMRVFLAAGTGGV